MPWSNQRVVRGPEIFQSANGVSVSSLTASAKGRIRTPSPIWYWTLNVRKSGLMMLRGVESEPRRPADSTMPEESRTTALSSQMPNALAVPGMPSPV